MVLRRRPGTALVSVIALLIALGAAHAEESQPLSGRVMQWFGVGGDAKDKDAQPAAAKPAEPPAPQAGEAAAPALPEGTYIPGANIIIVGAGPTQNRVLKMMGVLGGEDAAESTEAAETARKKALASGITECPDIVVDGAGAEMRSPRDADASSVAYQLSITRMARDCVLAGQNVSVRVGLLGAAILGPVGKPGNYFASLRVAMRRKSDNQLFGAKTYRIGATIPASQSRADFTLLVEDLSAPFVNAKAAEDYEVLVGFAGATNEGGEKKRRGKKAGG